MRTRHAFVFPVAATLVCGFGNADAGDALVSGPQPGSKLPGVFQPLPLNFTNAERPTYAGRRNDYVEQLGSDPVVLVFGRSISGPLTDLVKKLDAEVSKNRAARLRVVVVVLSDDDTLERVLREYGERQGIGNVSLAVMRDGPKHYELSKEADVTVVMHKRLKVEANHAVQKGGLDAKATERILADVSKLLSGKDR